jgi:hypothetical protein
MTLDPRDTSGLTIHYSGSWEVIDVSSDDYIPGVPFRLLVGIAGDLAVKGTDMNKRDVIPIPLPVGFAPLLCDAVLNDAGNTADGLIALF